MAPNGIVATSQPLAAQAGLSTLQNGGNAIDAAITAAATLNVVEPGSTGIGGDVFALLYDSEQNSLVGLNSSGWAPIEATIDLYKRKGFDEMPSHGVFSITIPGALMGWETLLERYGTLSFKDVFKPAISYAVNGFPVSEKIAWKGIEKKLLSSPGGEEYLINGRGPRPGESFRQKNLAKTFKAIAENGSDVFYKGEIATKIVDFVKKNGGIMNKDDFSEFEPEWVQPLGVDYEGYTLYELPPNCQGLCALEALQIVSGFELREIGFNTPEYLHRMIESMKLAFLDGHQYITDPRFRDVPIKRLISENYCEQKRELIAEKAITTVTQVAQKSDTVYLTVVDKDRNMVSFINSLYYTFGSGVVIRGTGIALQNRGASFKLIEEHNNSLEPRKRPYHTIIPAMLHKKGEPYMSFGVMGAHMQPQGHLQVVSNIVNFHMNPQDALDAPRFRFEEGKKVLLEDTMPLETMRKLVGRGHEVEVRRHFSPSFGGGQIIVVEPTTGHLFAGSDPRKDGCAIGY